MVAASPVLTSRPLPRSAQTPLAAAVCGGFQVLNACGDTPSTSAVLPLILILPPSTESTARTPLSLPILASSAGVIPDGAAAMRSGTSSCRGGAPADPGGRSDPRTEPAEEEEEAGADQPGEAPAGATPTGGGTVIVYGLVPPGPEAVAAPAGTASPARQMHAAAPATAIRTARRTGTD